MASHQGMRVLGHLKILAGGKLCVEFKGEWEWGPSDEEEKLEDINSNTA